MHAGNSFSYRSICLCEKSVIKYTQSKFQHTHRQWVSLIVIIFTVDDRNLYWISINMNYYRFSGQLELNGMEWQGIIHNNKATCFLFMPLHQNIPQKENQQILMVLVSRIQHLLCILFTQYICMKTSEILNTHTQVVLVRNLPYTWTDFTCLQYTTQCVYLIFEFLSFSVEAIKWIWMRWAKTHSS